VKECLGRLIVCPKSVNVLFSKRRHTESRLKFLIFQDIFIRLLLELLDFLNVVSTVHFCAINFDGGIRAF